MVKPTQRREQVALITSAPEPASTAMGSRERRYLFSMAIRTICFVGAVMVDGPLRWVLLVGAVFLPYVSVVLANAGVRMRVARGTDFVPMEHRSIEAGTARDAL